MKKRTIYITLFLIFIIGVISLIGTFAIDSSITEGNSTKADYLFNITLGDRTNRDILIPGYDSKIVDIKISNPNEFNISYLLYLEGVNSNISIVNIGDTDANGVINSKCTNLIKVFIQNNSGTDTTVSIKDIVGFEREVLELPSNSTAINKGVYYKTIVKSNNKDYGKVKPNIKLSTKNGTVKYNIVPNDGYRYKSTTCEGTVIDNILTISNITSNISCEVVFEKNTVQVNLDMAGGVVETTYTKPQEYTYTIAYAGAYKIELWGAQGGGTNGGKGAYTAGNTNFDTNEVLKIYVGGSGNSSGAGGYNGGGNAGALAVKNDGGGGSTDVRYDGTTINSRIMVAGGGGGANANGSNAKGVGKTGGAAGGLSGYAGTSVVDKMYGSGGTQISGGAKGKTARVPGTDGSFYNGGVGGTSSDTPTISGGGGGGGGYYGGGSGEACLGNCGGSGGGGSSYISGHTGCVAITSASSATPKTGCTTGTSDNSCSIHYSGKTFTDTVMIDGSGYAWTNSKGSLQQMPSLNGSYASGTGNSGNGAARITLTGNASYTVTYKDKYGTLPTPTKSGYTFGGWYTGENGTGTKVDENTVLTNINNHTLYAYWIKSTSVLYDYIKNNADTTTTIDFSQTSEASSTNGIYTTSDTDSGNPVYYYRGNVDNHVLFANMCWRIIRTTETGGVKLIYNGVQKYAYETTTPIEKSFYTNVTNDTTYPYTFNSTNKTWTSTNKTHSATGSIAFSVATAGDYVLSYTVSSERYDMALFYKNGIMLEEHSGTEEGKIILSELTTSDVIKVEYKKNSSTSSGSDTVVFSVSKGEGNAIKTCNNMGYNTTIGNSEFNSSGDSHVYVGYMYGTIYRHSFKKISSLSGSIVFGNDITYTNGTYTLKDTYTLTDVSNWSTEYSTIANKYRYTCFTSSNTCKNINYIDYAHFSSVLSNSYTYYFELSNGKNYLDILKEMSDSTTNTNDSTIKGVIDSWYKSNMANYTSQLEDTVFCNDRSFTQKNYTVSDETDLEFGAKTRLEANKAPTLKCPNAGDKFTISTSNGNGSLTYPVGLITADETVYAGGVYEEYNSSFYLYTGSNYWALSPWWFYLLTGIEFSVGSIGPTDSYNIIHSHGVRPVISLKSGATVTGSGTAASPFVVE